MALSDDNEPGDTGVFAFGRLVFENVGLSYAGHIQRIGIVIQEVPDQVLIPHLVDISAVTVDNQVHPTSKKIREKYAGNYAIDWSKNEFALLGKFSCIEYHHLCPSTIMLNSARSGEPDDVK
jgi:hypothetical protein